MAYRPPSPTLASSTEQAAHQQSGLDPPYVSYDGHTISPTSSEPTTNEEQYAGARQKRKTPPNPTGNKPSKKVKRVGPMSDSKAEVMTSADGEKDGDGSASKPKRVRTGCLTCRERHLKCDEGMPNCNNCNKSNRECKRGVRLNFIDLWVERPPTMVSNFGTESWKVDFVDESREIASEYQGGTKAYRPSEQETSMAAQQHDPSLTFDFALTAPPPQRPLPPMQSMLPNSYLDQSQQSDMSGMYTQQVKPEPVVFTMPPNSGSTHDTQYGGSGPSSVVGQASVTSFNNAQAEIQSDDKREYLDNQQETLFMQVFIEEVGLWMDSMDSLKHFSRLLPFHALSEPMLLNAFLACGARHLTLVNPSYTEEKALEYYDTSTRYLLQNLQNPNRDTVICATTAVILNVYEIMSERALQRMNHIAGARALIKECGWNARSQGIGSACFWLNVGLEVLSCLHFNWQVAWDPDDWAVDMDFTREIINGREEVWTHRMLYILAKVCNFRATMPRHPEPDPRDDQIRTQQRYEEWSRLRGWVDAWNDGIPRTMQPMAFLYPYQTSSKSVFPEVWLVKRTAIVARLFFHTAQLLLAQTHPYYGNDNLEMTELAKRHSNMICGIVAHVKDRGVASVALRSLAHAAEILTDRREQEEVLQIFDKINKETGWRIGFVYGDLKAKWGWGEEPSPREFAQTHTALLLQKKKALEEEEEEEERRRGLREQGMRGMQMQQGFSGGGGGKFTAQSNLHHGGGGSSGLLSQPLQQQQQSAAQPQPPPLPPPAQPPAQPPRQKKPPSGIPNPMYAKADFNKPNHPYQAYYVPPSTTSAAAFGNHPQGNGLYYSLGFQG
ncbi:hypothetical protein B0A55_10551 [Friedmanniomyces simplex]|uniref:Zn(2)-C6 fungal-type domain-containing protein n=1 Tax=Friedmanniomyces simplex TaxID=329884 RepID=A0A4U0WQT4_9PEZI|nr:hypothetical protein B0A55_10551 [Friedmanniomyces simplex]